MEDASQSAQSSPSHNQDVDNASDSDDTSVLLSRFNKHRRDMKKKKRQENSNDDDTDKSSKRLKFSSAEEKGNR